MTTHKVHGKARAARDEALGHLGEDSARFSAAIDRYVNAVEVADAARRQWEAQERPFETRGSMGQLVEHPLIRTMERLDRAAAAFGAALGLDPQASKKLGTRGVGRPAESVPKIRQAASVRLRAVKDGSGGSAVLPERSVPASRRARTA